MIVPQHPRGLPGLVEFYQKAVGLVFLIAGKGDLISLYFLTHSTPSQAEQNQNSKLITDF